MSYYIAKTVDCGFDDTVAKVREALAGEGFGVLTEIDVKATLKKKLDVEFDDYLILGACNPPLAHRALQSEPWIGTMLPCNVVVRRGSGGKTEIAAVDPVASMQSVENPSLRSIAEDVRARLDRVVASV